MNWRNHNAPQQQATKIQDFPNLLNHSVWSLIPFPRNAESVDFAHSPSKHVHERRNILKIVATDVQLLNIRRRCDDVCELAIDQTHVGQAEALERATNHPHQVKKHRIMNRGWCHWLPRRDITGSHSMVAVAHSNDLT